MRVVKDFDEMQSLVGTELGVSKWFDVSQERIDQFADATGDHQWIHVDVERAKTDMPGGKTIAHGYLTLSLVPMMIQDVYRLESVRQSLNYGSNRIRFTSPVPSGSRVRGRYQLKSTEPVKNDGLRIIGEVTVDIDGQDRPALVAEVMAIVYA